MIWLRSFRADPYARLLADKHYSRQKIGAKQFVPPGRALVLLTECKRAYWTTSWPFAEYVGHFWAGAWICSAFRNEGAGLSSELIRDAVSATRAFFGEPPALGMVTFVDPDKVKKKRDPGRCFLRAGFRRTPCQYCEGNGVQVDQSPCKKCEGEGQARTETERLLVFDMPPSTMPPPSAAIERQATMF